MVTPCAQGEKRNEFTMIILLIIIIIIVKKEGKCHTHKDEKRRGVQGVTHCVGSRVLA